MFILSYTGPCSRHSGYPQSEVSLALSHVSSDWLHIIKWWNGKDLHNFRQVALTLWLVGTELFVMCE